MKAAYTAPWLLRARAVAATIAARWPWVVLGIALGATIDLIVRVCTTTN